MSDKIEKAAAWIQARYEQENATWETIAQELSKMGGESISKAAVWRLVHEQRNSIKIFRALGLIKKRYRRSAEFIDLGQLREFERFLQAHQLTLTNLCRGLTTGQYRLIVIQSKEADGPASGPLSSSALNHTSDI